MVDLFAHLVSLHPLPDDLVRWLRSVSQEQLLERKEYAVRAGKLSLNIYFVQSGLLRCSYNKEGKDISSGFFREEQLCFPVEHFFRQPYGMENIQALETTRVQLIPFQRWQQAYRGHPAFRSLGLIIMEKIVEDLQLRWQKMWMRPAPNRYRWLKEHSSWLLERVPAKYLASYIGISPTMLSRIRAAV